MTDFGSNINDYIIALFGEDAVRKYSELALLDSTQFLRVNTLKTSLENLAHQLQTGYGITSSPVDRFAFALRIDEGNKLAGKTVEHICGDYYIQSLSSMLPPLALNPSPADKVLDLCAAPGSKSTELSWMMQNKGTLILNEIQTSRVRSLIFNIDRMNSVNAGVLNFRGEWLSRIYDHYFDKVLVDAPCSGLGILQKKSEIGNWWNEDKLNGLSELQYKLLVSALKMVKIGGEIVYSTCTLTVEENEAVINKILEKYPVEIIPVTLPLSANKGVLAYQNKNFHASVEVSLRLNPWEFFSEGFFIVKFRKIGKTEPAKPQEFPKPRISFASPKQLQTNFSYLSDIFGFPPDVLADYAYIIRGNDIFFLDSGWYDENLDSFTRIGTKFGSFDKDGKITLHTQAAQILGNHFTSGVFEASDISHLKTYLSGGTIKTECGLNGQVAIKFNGKILGTALSNQGSIKSRFPRSKRTQEIIFPGSPAL